MTSIEESLSAVLALHPEVRFAILFGSAATRGFERAQDIDVAVEFVGSPSLFEIGHLASELEAATDREVDVVDLAAATTLMQWEVLRTGRVLCDRDPAALSEFRTRTPLEYFDLEPYLEREAEGLRRSLRVGRWSASTS